MTAPVKFQDAWRRQNQECLMKPHPHQHVDGCLPSQQPLLLSIFFFFCMAWGCQARTEETPTVEPGKLYAGPIVNIHAPATAGWSLSRADTQGMNFIRRDVLTGVTFSAEVLISKFDPALDLLEAAKTIAGRRSHSERYRVLESKFELSSERSYPGVRFRGLIQDTQARTPEGTVSLPIHVRSLFFRHPTKKDLVFDVTFSQRGGSAKAELEAQAESFIRGVEVPLGK